MQTWRAGRVVGSYILPPCSSHTLKPSWQGNVSSVPVALPWAWLLALPPSSLSGKMCPFHIPPPPPNPHHHFTSAVFPAVHTHLFLNLLPSLSACLFLFHPVWLHQKVCVFAISLLPFLPLCYRSYFCPLLYINFCLPISISSFTFLFHHFIPLRC